MSLAAEGPESSYKTAVFKVYLRNCKKIEKTDGKFLRYNKPYSTVNRIAEAVRRMEWGI